ncbi:hypothetical protein J7K93_06210 [bacterium]|nr:hypothetical protein [bacterium]
MNKNRDTLVWGIFLVLAGIIFLAGTLSDYGLEMLWPLFPLAIGLAFIIKFIFNRKNISGLMPGSLLTVVALLLFYCNSYGWNNMENLWPVFIIAPAVGFFALYFAGQREKSNIISGSVLAGIGILFLVANSKLGQFWPVILIVIGIILVAANWKVRGEKE